MFSCQENETITTKVDSTQVGITTEQWETAQKYQHYNTVRFPEK